MGVMDRLYSFIVIRGFKVWISYRTQVALNLASWSLPVFIYYFIGIALGSGAASLRGSYVAFVTVGLAFQGYFSSSITTLAGRIRNEELIGTLEYDIASPLNPISFMMYSSTWGLAINSINALMTLLIGLGLGVKYHVDWVSWLFVMLLYMVSIIGLNLIAGATVLIVKQGNPVALFASVASNLLGGTVFPVTVLPKALTDVSYAIPLTWALDGFRSSMLDDAAPASLINDLIPLAILSAIYLAVGVYLTYFAFSRIMREGSVQQY